MALTQRFPTNDFQAQEMPESDPVDPAKKRPVSKEPAVGGIGRLRKKG